MRWYGRFMAPLHANQRGSTRDGYIQRITDNALQHPHSGVGLRPINPHEHPYVFDA
ncbi:MAG: hypothetical protein CM1200mP22_29280 [Dehalococcoidia bacterium]|nr:MAG: hypothetical protein CM1200mP22_29280 [Dehalococcoidia bacterium]